MNSSELFIPSDEFGIFRDWKNIYLKELHDLAREKKYGTTSNRKGCTK